jgi:hypothetical protein
VWQSLAPKSRREDIDMRLFFTLGVTLAVFASLRADEQQHGHNTLTEKEKAAGWVLLFDGKSTDGWEIRPNKDRVAVRDGCLEVTATANEGTMILSKHPFYKYELRFEYRLAGDRNAGIEAMGLRGSEEKQADVWSEVTVRYTGGLEIKGELKEPGVGTKRMQCFLFKDLGVPHPTRFTVREDTKLSLRNIKIRKL